MDFCYPSMRQCEIAYTTRVSCQFGMIDHLKQAYEAWERGWNSVI